MRFASVSRAGWSPALGLSLAHYWSGGVVETGGTAHFTLDASFVDLCPLGLAWGRVGAWACAEAALGVLSAHGSDTFSPRSRSRPFAALSGGARLRLELFAKLGVFAGFSWGKNLVEDRFAFSPSVFYSVPPWGWRGALGGELRFP
jgi:hypothetical protein